MNSSEKAEMTVATSSAGFALPVLNQAAPSVIPSKKAKTESPFNTGYWMSVEEKLQLDASADPVFGEEDGEFPAGSTALDAVGRRDFAKLLGASMALAGVGMSCQRPPTEVMVPYHKNPDGVTVGNPLHYATALTYGGFSTSVLVKAREGRPIKIEGNPDHPSVKGKAGSLELAHLLQMYDPNRAKLIKERGGRSMARKPFAEQISNRLALANERGAKIRFLVDPSGSPLLASLREEVKAKLPDAKFVSYTAISQQNRHDGARAAFGLPLEPVYDFTKAKVVLSLDENFLLAWGPNLANAHGWAASREPGSHPWAGSSKDMSRLYVVEPAITVTGSVADHRLRLRGSQIEGFARAVAKQLGGALGGVSGELQLTPDQAKYVSAVVEDLKAAGPNALVVAGERQGAAVHALAYAMNGALGAIGTTMTLIEPTIDDTATGPAALRTLVDEISAGQVDTLVITAKNPLYARYADIDLAGAIAKVENSFYLGLFEDETAAVTRTFINAAHALESWGDAKAIDGSILIQQPLVEPLYAGVTEAQLLAMWAGRGDVKGLDLLKGLHVKKNGMLDADFSKALQLGFLPASNGAVDTAVGFDRVVGLPATPAVNGLELALVRCAKVHDGALSNVPWLQELPDPITKIVWDNALMVSPKTAKEKFNIEMRSLMSAPEREARVAVVKVGEKTLRVPIWIAPGHADDTVTLALGYGRTSKSEKVANGESFDDAKTVGADAYALRTSTSPWFMTASVDLTTDMQQLSCTQEHWDMHDRKIALESSLEDLNSGHVKDSLEELVAGPAKLTTEQSKLQVSLQQPVDYSKVEYKWGMAVDLNRCTGCSACITACQSENNIPVVGRDGVKRNREMFWLRLDRYFSSDLNDPQVITQMVTCQQCETAPCEYVCPVNATVHSEEGLNDMIYNRCIGTRYCSNNCPYKVRRFNYFNYTGEYTSSQKLAQNPDVTVRARGVMEKCTFCVQRIETARIVSRRSDTHLTDGAVQTACQQACPTSAIEFGNLNDPLSRVSRAHENDRAYNLLQQLGTRPRNRYLTRVRNQNPKLMVAKAAPAEHQEAHE